MIEAEPIDLVENYVLNVELLDKCALEVESSSPPIDGKLYKRADSVEEAMVAVKTTMTVWPNKLSPQCYATPRSIEGWNPQLDANLQLLERYQKFVGTEDVAAGIQSTAQSILDIVGPSYNLMSRLVKELTAFEPAVTKTGQQLLDCHWRIYNDSDWERQRLSSLQAQLARLQHASKPDKKKIAEVQVRIAESQQQLAAAQAWDQAIEPILFSMAGARQAVAFLSSYWSDFAEDLAHVQGTLRLIRSNPKQLETVDLAAVIDSWQRLYGAMVEICERLQR